MAVRCAGPPTRSVRPSPRWPPGLRAPQTTMTGVECHSHPDTWPTLSRCAHAVSSENTPRARLRPRHGRPPVKPERFSFRSRASRRGQAFSKSAFPRFSVSIESKNAPGDRRFLYWRDPVCVTACATYVVYHWLMPAVGVTPLWNGHVTDVLLIPAGLPFWLWLERRLGWRDDDGVPRWREVAFALVTWTVAAELIAPRLFSQATGDVWDSVAYAGGAVIAGLLWRPPCPEAKVASGRNNCVEVTGPDKILCCPRRVRLDMDRWPRPISVISGAK